jgi:hypothetical protein
MLCLHRTLGVAVVGASLIAVPHLVPPSPGVQVRAVRLTSGDTRIPRSGMARRSSWAAVASRRLVRPMRM